MGCQTVNFASQEEAEVPDARQIYQTVKDADKIMIKLPRQKVKMPDESLDIPDFTIKGEIFNPSIMSLKAKNMVIKQFRENAAES